MKSKLLAIALCVAGIGFSVPAGAVSLVTNGDFETGDFTGWTQFGADTGNDSVCNGVCPHSGNFGASFGAIESDSGISQNIVTTPSAHYTVSFWFRNRDFLTDPTPNDYSISFGGTTLTSGSDISPFPYTLFSYDVSATSASSTLSFSFRNVPSFFNIDDVTVGAVATPLPAALPMFLGGAGLIGFMARRRKQKAVDA